MPRVLIDFLHTMHRLMCDKPSLMFSSNDHFPKLSSFVFINQNPLHVVPQMIFLLTKMCLLWEGEFSGSHRRLCTPSYTFTGFHCWTHMYNQKYWGFHPWGYLSLLVTTRHKFSCSANRGTLLNFVQRYTTHSSTTKDGV